MSSDGKSYLTDCANTEGVLRIIMSVPSSKAEPFKLWMAQVSNQNIQETENPELGFERMREIYKKIQRLSIISSLIIFTRITGLLPPFLASEPSL